MSPCAPQGPIAPKRQRGDIATAIAAAAFALAAAGAVALRLRMASAVVDDR